jgi:NAD(P)-dependent dehydrogenase (short-subunit alcohol dehydrogenase family)
MANRVAVVTGASWGIGREIALTLADQGFRVRSLGRNPGIDETHRIAAERGLDLRIMEGDVSKSAQVDEFRKWVLADGGAITALVNNAAIRKTGTVLTTSEEDWELIFAVDVKGVFLVTRAFLPEMIKAGGGAVVNISSCSAMGSPNLIAYSSAKCALLAFTRCLAEDHKKERIRANAILPGPTESGMMQGIPEEMIQWCAENGVQGRLGQPSDIAHAAAFLVSDKAIAISGTELRVNFWPALFG